MLMNGILFRRPLTNIIAETPSTEKKVIAMSLYGADKRYTANAIRNLQFAKDYFPDWTLRFYVPSHTGLPAFII